MIPVRSRWGHYNFPSFLHCKSMIKTGFQWISYYFIVPNSSQWAPTSSTAAKTEPSTRSAQCSQPSSGDDVPPLRRLLPPCQPFHRVENHLEPTWPVTNIQVLKMIQWRFYIFGKLTNLCHLKSFCWFQPAVTNHFLQTKGAILWSIVISIHLKEHKLSFVLGVIDKQGWSISNWYQLLQDKPLSLLSIMFRDLKDGPDHNETHSDIGSEANGAPGASWRYPNSTCHRWVAEKLSDWIAWTQQQWSRLGLYKTTFFECSKPQRRTS